MEKMTEIFDLKGVRDGLTVVIEGAFEEKCVLQPEDEELVYKLPKGKLKEVRYQDPLKGEQKIYKIKPDPQQGKYYLVVLERDVATHTSWDCYTVAEFGSHGGCKIIEKVTTDEGDQITLVEIEAKAAFQIHYDLSCLNHGRFYTHYLCIDGEVKPCSTTENNLSHVINID